MPIATVLTFANNTVHPNRESKPGRSDTSSPTHPINHRRIINNRRPPPLSHLSCQNMLGKRSRPSAIGNPSAKSVRAGITCRPTSPGTPMTPYAHVGGVGLGIVVVARGDSSKVVAECAVGGQFLEGSTRNIVGRSKDRRHCSCEDRDGTGFPLVVPHGFCASSDFLSSCALCRKPLQGKDIFMYRGEKAFCSADCRQRQIAMEERKEQCMPEASRSAGTDPASISGTTGDVIFSAGIVTA